MSSRLLLLACLAVIPRCGWADIVHLKSGRTIEGSVRPGQKAGTVEVRIGEGSAVVIPESNIASIEKKPSPLSVFAERLGKIPAGKLEPLQDLLVWARDKRLHSKVRLAARKILEIDPNNELGRRELGYSVYENRWILKAELKKKGGLVYFRDEWMTEAEKERRLEADAKKEIEDLLDLVGSENRYIQEFSVRKILSRREPVVREIFSNHIRDSREEVRMVAIRGLANFPWSGREGKEIVERVHRVALEDESEKVREVIRHTLKSLNPRESFRLALGTARSSPHDEERRRAADLLYHLTRKAWVPELCRAVISENGRENGGRQHREVREALQRILGVDFGYDPAGWLRYWRHNAGEFDDSY